MKTLTKTQEPNIFFISDIHGQISVVDKAVNYVKKHNIDIIVLGGDTPDATKGNFLRILKKFLKTKLPVIVYPGSHENGEIYKQVMQELKGEKNLYDAYQKSKRIFKANDYELIIIPGSDVVGRGTKAWNGGTFWLVEKNSKLKHRTTLSRMNERLKEMKFARYATPVYFKDIEKIIKEKSKAPASKKILFGHSTSKHKTSRGIDLACFGVTKKEFTLKRKVHIYNKGFQMPKNGLILKEVADKLKKQGYPVKIMKKNVGNAHVNKLLNKFRITKFIAGHIHEAGPRAINKKEQNLKQNTPTKEIFLNNGYGLKGHATLLTLTKKGVVHKFLKL